MRGFVLVLPLVACTSQTWTDMLSIDPPPPSTIGVGSSRRFSVMQEALDTSFDLTGGGDGYFPSVPTNWSVDVQVGAAVIAVHKISNVDASFIVDALALGNASIEVMGENGATVVVDLAVVP
jgi:hypothetical protein